MELKKTFPTPGLVYDNAEIKLYVSKNSSNKSGQNDKDLWNAFREGSLTAFRLIYEQNVDNLFNYGNKITSYRAIASDCMQDLFVDLWTKRSKLGKVSSIRGYLFTAYRRRLIDLLNTQKKKNLQFEDLSGFAIYLSEPIKSWDLSEDKKATIKAALNELPYQQREAIYLRYFNDLSCSEVGVIMGIKTQSVYNLISSSLKSLRTSISFLDTL
ncbi:MAG: sigma-70 family RNA polymerase sigma factor [Cyclobacteriaceae bacterium]